MALRKIFLAVECADDVERDAMQNLANEISNMRVLNAHELLTMAPLFRANKDAFAKLFKMIAKGGPKALLSMEGAKLLTSFKR